MASVMLSPAAYLPGKQCFLPARRPTSCRVLSRSHTALPLKAIGDIEPRIYREAEEGAEGTTGAASDAPKNPNSQYIDELPPIKKSPMSEEMKQKIKDEYIGLGGSANRSMGQNWFAIIILVVSVLAILTKLTGAI